MIESKMEVDSVEPEPGSPLEKTLTAMRERGVKLIYGNWLIEGAPRVILFDTGSMYHRFVPCHALARLCCRGLVADLCARPNRLGSMDEWKTDLWNLAGIPSPANDHETNETIVFG